MKPILPSSVAVLALSVLGASSGATVFVGFEDLAAPPALDAAASLFDANGGSSVYTGVTWDARLRVVGDEHRTGNDPANPLNTLPHGPHFNITNEAYPDGGDAITLGTSTVVLTGAWFGQINYYGFGHGAMTITIEAMNGPAVLGSASVNLPANTGFDPLPMEFLDSSSFLSLAGITGYRINQSPVNPGTSYWSADDFQFTPVPEPAGIALATSASLAILGFWRRRRSGAR